MEKGKQASNLQSIAIVRKFNINYSKTKLDQDVNAHYLELAHL